MWRTQEFRAVGPEKTCLRGNVMKKEDFLMTREQLEEHRLEIENRIRNLFWTVSGDYSLEVYPDAETFVQSKSLALYDAVKQGTFVRHFDAGKLAMYALKKRTLGADEGLLMELVRLCVDEAAYPLVFQERSGVEEIRRQAFEDFLEMDAEPDIGQPAVCRLYQIRHSLMLRFLGREDDCPPELLTTVQRIEKLSQVRDTDEIIRVIDAIYNSLIEPDFEQSHGCLQNVNSVTMEEMMEYQRFQELSDEQMQTVLDEYLNVVKREMLRMRRNHKKSAGRSTPQITSGGEAPEPSPEAVEKMYAYMERNFGKCSLTPLERERLNRSLCTGIHKRCSLYFTAGILQDPSLKSTQYMRNNMQKIKNDLYFANKQRVIRRNVKVLASMLRQVKIMRLDEESSRADYGQLNPSRLWKVKRTTDGKLFDAKRKREDSHFVMDILLDGSSSQSIRQPQIATQGYIISQALSEAKIPHRVSSFCSFRDYTIVHRFRDYDDSAENNKNILQFHALGENRDGLAIRTVCAELYERTEESKVLIILSDGRPNHLGSDHPWSRRPAPYVGEEAVKDTAFEVRKARNNGIAVLGIFVGDEEDLNAEKKIFGKEFTYIRNISSFSHIVGTYLRKQMEADL